MASRSPVPFLIAFGIVGFALLAYVGVAYRPTKTTIAAAPERTKPVATPEPEPTVEPAKVAKPETTPADVQAVISKNRGQLKACLDECLKEDPKCAGKVVTTLTINDAGNTVSASSTTTDAPKTLVSCIVKKLKAMRFPPADAGLRTLVVPVTLQAAD
jgi:hypothetical protein